MKLTKTQTTIALAVCHQGYGITGGVDPETVTGFDFTADMLAWAEANGLDIGNPDVYVTVSADAELADDVADVIAWADFPVPADQADAVRAAYEAGSALRAEAFDG